MPPTPTAQKRAVSPWIKNILLFLLLAGMASFLSARFSASSQGTDFPDFYCASRMVLAGHGAQLYDPALQREYQARYAGRVGTLYIHPPFETAVYLAVAWLPMQRAYVLWCLINLAFLGYAAWAVSREDLLRWDWRLLLVAVLTFVPVLLCLLQGQDSILLLLLVTLAYAALRHERAFVAGCWLGLGLFKFQIVLPMAVVFVAMKGRSRFLAGFGVAALALASLSAAISGISVFNAYPRFLLHLQQQPFAGIAPRAMANFRGLVYLVLDTDRSPVAIATIAIVSGVALVLAWFAISSTLADTDAGGQRRLNSTFATATLFALLVSFHLNPHDLSLLLLPIALLPGNVRRRWVYGLLAFVFLPPLQLLALQMRSYALVGIPLFAWFAVSAYSSRRTLAPFR